MVEVFGFFVLLLDAMLRVSVPLVLAAMAGLFAERSGVVDISLEGKMLGAAFAAAAIAALTNSLWLGLAAGIIASIALALLHGYACITHNGNQVVSGVAINILVAGLTVVLGITMFHQGGRTPQLPPEARFLPINWPGARAVADVPIVGQLYSELLSGHNLLVYVAFLAIPLTWWIVYRTRFGLRLRAVGENPEAVDTAGISVAGMRYRAMVVAGFLCGIAGTYLSMAQSAGFIRDMSAGKGFIALAALIFGKWRPVPVMFACLLFGFLEAGSARLQGAFDVERTTSVLMQQLLRALPFFIDALPFILVVLLLAGFVGTAVAPRASGIPYIKER
ncbi:MAG: ABC transporter permease [Alphaproteobacteria bacterium]